MASRESLGIVTSSAEGVCMSLIMLGCYTLTWLDDAEFGSAKG